MHLWHRPICVRINQSASPTCMITHISPVWYQPISVRIDQLAGPTCVITHISHVWYWPIFERIDQSAGPTCMITHITHSWYWMISIRINQLASPTNSHFYIGGYKYIWVGRTHIYCTFLWLTVEWSHIYDHWWYRIYSRLDPYIHSFS